MLFNLAVILLPLLAAASTNDVLFDTSGATPFYSNSCDDCYEEVNLNSTYGFFGDIYNTVYVGSNGYLTFDQGYSWTSTSVSSPSTMLAPYWSDIDQGSNFNNAEISFQETQDNNLLEEAKRAIEGRIFPGCGDLFEPTSLFIATWENVASYCETYYSDDSVDSFDYFYYDSIDRSHNYPDDYGDYYDMSSYLFDDESSYAFPDYSDSVVTLYDTYCNYYSDSVDYTDESHEDFNDLFSHITWTDFYDYPDHADGPFYSDSYDVTGFIYSDYGDDKRRDVYDRRGRPNKQQKLPDAEAEGKSQNIAEENTFQVILATDGCDTFAIINFVDIQWTLCGTRGMVFTAGDGVGYYLNPEIQLDGDTNVHQQGRWVYKISESKIRGPGCDIIST